MSGARAPGAARQPTVLLTLGRLPKALDLARSFHGLGWRVVVAEPHPRHLCWASRSVAACHAVPAPADDPAAYRAALAAIVRAEGVSLVLPVSEEILTVAPLAPLLPAGCRLFAMPAETLEALHDKGRFPALARAAGLAVPETFALGSDDGLALVRSGPVVVKPAHGCGGAGLRFVEAGGCLPCPDPARPAVVQRRIDGEEVSSCSLVHAGQVTATVIYRALLTGGRVAVAFERITHDGAERWARSFAAATSFTGFLSFDMIIDRSGVAHAIECNPRLTSGVHFFSASDLARAIMEPGVPLRVREGCRRMQAWSVLTEVQAALLRGQWARYRKGLATLVTSRDVTFRLADPLPFLTMPWTAWPILAAAARERRPLAEVALRDLAVRHSA